MDLKPAALESDWYASFDALADSEQEGTHYRIVHERRASPIAIVAPHGGSIEPGTSQIAMAIAGDTHNFYCFEGLLPRSEPHARLHITSHRFDEPRCLDLVARCDHVVTVHGMRELSERIAIGGLDAALRAMLFDQLSDEGFAAQIIDKGRYSALSPLNICNRGRSGRGVQLELGRDLRVLLRTEPERLARFAAIVRSALAAEPA
jgi:phage replication-related protein YjqB (UPF0714/DUF867 family)